MKAQLLLIKIILETLENESFVPLGPLYVGLSTQGITLSFFNSILELLEKSKAIKKTSETMEKGEHYKKTMTQLKVLLPKE